MSKEITFPIHWTSDFECGVASIDEQHQILVHTLNKSHEQYVASKNSIKMLTEATEDLLSYALYHFEEEEMLMQECGYQRVFPDEAQFHLNQHRYFSNKIISMRESLRSETPIPSEEFLDFLKDWLLNHIMKVDFKLAKFINEKKQSTQAQ